MSIERGNERFPGERTVSLGGKEFVIAPLSLRQILAIADHVPKLAGITAENMSGERLRPMTSVVWQGLRRAHPDLGYEEFLDMPMTMGELVAAIPVVIEQAGGTKANGAAADAPAGE